MTDDASPVLLAVARREGGVTVTLSGGETLELAPDALPAGLPSPGRAVPPDVLAQLRAAADRKAIAKRVFALLDRRPWTLGRLRARLAADGYPEPAVVAVLARFAAEGLIDDRRFAEAFVRDALRRKPVGRQWLRARLAAQAVPAADVEAALAALLPLPRERELALLAAAERWRRAGAPTPAAVARVARFLAARGFAPALARGAAREAAPRGAGGPVDGEAAAEAAGGPGAGAGDGPGDGPGGGPDDGAEGDGDPGAPGGEEDD